MEKMVFRTFQTSGSIKITRTEKKTALKKRRKKEANKRENKKKLSHEYVQSANVWNLMADPKNGNQCMIARWQWAHLMWEIKSNEQTIDSNCSTNCYFFFCKMNEKKDIGNWDLLEYEIEWHSKQSVTHNYFIHR